MSYLLRISLPNRPGALGALATALGAVGGDIQNLIVVERTAGRAVDDILIDLPPPGLAETLVTAAHSVAGVRVESLNRYSGRLDLQDDLALLDTLTGGTNDVLVRFATALPDVLRADWALIVDAGKPHAPGIATSPGAPRARPGLEWLPSTAARTIDPLDVWDDPAVIGPDPQLAAAPMGGPRRAVLVGRRGGPHYRQSELLRLHHLAAVVAAVASPASPGSSLANTV
jgi:hypothetical protein